MVCGIRFHPQGPTSLSVSPSGHVYCVDSEHVLSCNVLSITSTRAGGEGKNECFVSPRPATQYGSARLKVGE